MRLIWTGQNRVLFVTDLMFVYRQDLSNRRGQYMSTTIDVESARANTKVHLMDRWLTLICMTFIFTLSECAHVYDIVNVLR